MMYKYTSQVCGQDRGRAIQKDMALAVAQAVSYSTEFGARVLEDVNGALVWRATFTDGKLTEGGLL